MKNKQKATERLSHILLHGMGIYFTKATYAEKTVCCPGWRGLVVSSPPTTEDIEDMGREIESRQGIG
jgi:hypothetical protein